MPSFKWLITILAPHVVHCLLHKANDCPSNTCLQICPSYMMCYMLWRCARNGYNECHIVNKKYQQHYHMILYVSCDSEQQKIKSWCNNWLLTDVSLNKAFSLVKAKNLRYKLIGKIKQTMQTIKLFPCLVVCLKEQVDPHVGQIN